MRHKATWLNEEINRMSAEAKRKRGAPLGNQNARKHGFYSKVLGEAEQLDFELATGVEGIDDEIALLRVKVKSVLGKDPDNIKLIMEATNTLAGLVKTRYKITTEQKKGLKEAIGNVLKDIALPLGIGIGTAINK
jgi:hypothetical protein